MNKLSQIRDFINQWKVRAYNYYHQAFEDYKKDRDTYYNLPYSSVERYHKAQEIKAKYNQVVRQLATGYSIKDREERLTKIIEAEAVSKEKILIARVNKVVGNIVGATELYVGVNGELNGVIVGENGSCSIKTIYAGGYNIQCLHYRVLVKEVK